MDDIFPFVPRDWSIQWVRSYDGSRKGTRIPMITSLNGTQLRATPGERTLLNGAIRHVWYLHDGDVDHDRGWLARSRKKDPIDDLHQALQRADTLPERIRPIESWLLGQGIVGGTWTYISVKPGLYDRVRHVELPPFLIEIIAQLYDTSLVSDSFGSWHIDSGSDLIRITLPPTRHAVMERLMALRRLETSLCATPTSAPLTPAPGP